jgi:hypothetical protein
MIDIAIEYQYAFLKRKAKGKAPSAWDELTERQIIAISRMINGTEPDFRFLSMLTGIGQNLLKKLSPFELFKLTEGIDFVVQAGNSYSTFIIRKIPGTDYVSPKPKLAGMPFGQFIFTESYYNDWTSGSGSDSKQNETTLNNFIASLYLPSNEKFTNETIPVRVGKIANSELDIRKAIAFNYLLVMIWLQKAYPLIFQTPSDNQDSSGQVNDIPTKQSGWLKLFESLVGDDLINRDHYAELPLHTVLRHLTNKYKDSIRKG